jgi:hypothetical protein
MSELPNPDHMGLPDLPPLGPFMQRMDGDVIHRAVHNSPPPMDDVGGLDDSHFDQFDPDRPEPPRWEPDDDDDRLFQPRNPVPLIHAGEILQTAANIVAGARNVTHGPKERCHANIAILWRAYEELKVASGHPGPDTSWDVANKMELFKIARRFAGEGRLNPDNYIDAAGYSAIAGEIALNGEEMT